MMLSLLHLLLQAVSRHRQRQDDQATARRVADENRAPAPREMTPEDFLTIDADWLRAEEEDRRRAQEEIPWGEEITDPATKFLLSGQWLHPASSNVEAWRYLWDEHQLEIEFKGGGTQSFYVYYAVPPEVARAFYFASSPGRAVWNLLRDQYEYTRISALSGGPAPNPKPTVVRRTLPGEK